MQENNINQMLQNNIEKQFDNMVKILDANKKLVIAHDRSEKRDELSNLIIDYVINESIKKGIENPIVLRYSFEKRKNDNEHVKLVVLNTFSDIRNSPQMLINEGKKIVAIFIDDFDLSLIDTTISNVFKELVEELQSMNRDVNLICTISDYLTSPILGPYITLRFMNYQLIRLLGLELNYLPKVFYHVDDVDGAKSRPTNAAKNIYPIIAKYMDIDSYNYIDVNNFIKPEMYIEKANSLQMLAEPLVKNIINITNNDSSKDRTKRVHAIVYDKNFYKDEIISYLKSYAKNDINNKVGSVRVKDIRDIRMFLGGKREDFYTGRNEQIILVNKNVIETLYQYRKILRSISFIDGNFIDFTNFARAYSIAYNSDYYSDRNKIFYYMKDNRILYSYYCESKYLFENDKVFDKSKLKFLYDQYLNLGKVQTFTDLEAA